MNLHTIQLTDEELLSICAIVNTILMGINHKKNPSEQDSTLAKNLRMALDKMESKYYDEKFSDRLEKKIILSPNNNSH